MVEGIRHRHRGPAGPLLGRIDSQLPAVELVLVEAGDRLLGRFRILELDEGEAARSPRRPVGGEEDLLDRSDLGEQVRKLLLGGLVVQVTDEDSV